MKPRSTVAQVKCFCITRGAEGHHSSTPLVRTRVALSMLRKLEPMSVSCSLKGRKEERKGHVCSIHFQLLLSDSAAAPNSKALAGLQGLQEPLTRTLSIVLCCLLTLVPDLPATENSCCWLCLAWRRCWYCSIDRGPQHSCYCILLG